MPLRNYLGQDLGDEIPREEVERIIRAFKQDNEVGVILRGFNSTETAEITLERRRLKTKVRYYFVISRFRNGRPHGKPFNKGTVEEAAKYFCWLWPGIRDVADRHA